jgi:hypothetical protein
MVAWPMEGPPVTDARPVNPGSRTREAFMRHLGTGQVARVIYGAIIGMALIVALQTHPPSANEMTVALLSTAVAVGLAEGYSDLVGFETRMRRRVTPDELREILDDVLAVMFGIVFPDVFFGLAAVGAIQLDTAFGLAKWSGLGLIAFYGFCAARLAGERLAGAFLRGAAVGAIGGLLILLKSLVH